MGSSNSTSKEKYRICFPCDNLVGLYIELKANARRRNNIKNHYMGCINNLFQRIFSMLRTANTNAKDRLNYINLDNNFTSIKNKKKLADYAFISGDNIKSKFLENIYNIINDKFDYNSSEDIELLKLYLLVVLCKIFLQLPSYDLIIFTNPRNYFSKGFMPLFTDKLLPIGYIEFWDFFVDFCTNTSMDPYSYKLLIQHTRRKFTDINYSLWFNEEINT